MVSSRSPAPDVPLQIVPGNADIMQIYGKSNAQVREYIDAGRQIPLIIQTHAEVSEKEKENQRFWVSQQAPIPGHMRRNLHAAAQKPLCCITIRP